MAKTHKLAETHGSDDAVTYRVGDRVRYQTERMAEDREATVVAVDGETLTFDNGRSVLPNEPDVWIELINRPDAATVPAPKLAPSASKPKTRKKRGGWPVELKKKALAAMAAHMAEGMTVGDARAAASADIGREIPESSYYTWRKTYGFPPKRNSTHAPAEAKGKGKGKPATARRTYTDAERRAYVLEVQRLVESEGLTIAQACLQADGPDADSMYHKWSQRLGIAKVTPGSPATQEESPDPQTNKSDGKPAAEPPNAPAPQEPQEPCETDAETLRGPELERMRTARDKLAARRDAKRLRYAASRMRDVVTQQLGGDDGEADLMAAALVVMADWDEQDTERHGEAPSPDELVPFYAATYPIDVPQTAATTQACANDIDELVAGVHAFADLLDERFQEFVGGIRAIAKDLARAAAVIDELDADTEGAA